MKRLFSISMVMMLISCVLIAYAQEEAIPYSLRVLSSMQEEAFVVDGWYYDNDFYVTVQDAAKILGGKAKQEGGKPEIWIESGMRGFVIDVDGALYETNLLGNIAVYDTCVKTISVEGESMISAMDFFAYCDAQIVLDPVNEIQMIVRKPYTLRDVIHSISENDAAVCFFMEETGQEDVQLEYLLNDAYDKAILKKAKVGLDPRTWIKSIGENFYREQYIEEVLTDILETEDEDKISQQAKADYALSPFVDVIALEMARGDDGDLVSAKLLSEFSSTVKKGTDYAKAAYDVMYIVTRYALMDGLQEELLQRTLIDHADLCPSLSGENAQMLTIAQRLTVEMDDWRAAEMMEIAEKAIELAADTMLGGIGVKDLLWEDDVKLLDKLETINPLAPSEAELKNLSKDEEKTLKSAYAKVRKDFSKETGKQLKNNDAMDDGELIYKATIAGIVAQLANEQLVAHYANMRAYSSMEDYLNIAKDVRFALILQLKASICAREYLLKTGDRRISEWARRNMTERNEIAGQLLEDVMECKINAPRVRIATPQTDFSWMPACYEALEGVWTVDVEKSVGMWDGLLPALIDDYQWKAAAAAVQQEISRELMANIPQSIREDVKEGLSRIAISGDTISISLKDNTNISRGFRLVGKTLEFYSPEADYRFYLDDSDVDDIRLVCLMADAETGQMLRSLTQNTIGSSLSVLIGGDMVNEIVQDIIYDCFTYELYLKRSAMEAEGVEAHLRYGEVTWDVFDFDGDGVKDGLFYDQYGNMMYYYVQAIPAGAEVDGGNKAMAYDDTYPYFYPDKKYYANDRYGQYAEHDNPKWVSAEAVNYFGMERLNFCFLRAEDGILYAADSAVVNGANGWPECFVTFYQLDTASMECKMMPVEAVDLVGEYGDMLGGFGCEYVADLKQWCFVLEQVGENVQGSRYIKERTCLTFSTGNPVVLARYVDGVRVE